MGPMQQLRTANGIFLIVSLAAVGFLLVWLPPQIVEQYDRVKALGPGWTYAYFGLVGIGAALLLFAGCGAIWTLWSGTRRKRLARERTAKNPSQLSEGEKSKELADNLAAVDQLQTGGELSP